MGANRQTKHMIIRARQLRRGTTFPERLLWSRLRDQRCASLIFRRQQPIDKYVVDFFCPAARVAVELDGRSHQEQQSQDTAREAYLKQQGVRVIRFTNDEVLSNLDGVVRTIGRTCAPPPPATAGTSPARGGGVR